MTVDITVTPSALAPDLVAFARALADAGARLFGTAWCLHCTEQKQLFEDGSEQLPFIEVTNPDGSPNEIGIEEEINVYPTWEFPDGSRAEGLLDLDTISTAKRRRDSRIEDTLPAADRRRRLGSD